MNGPLALKEAQERLLALAPPVRIEEVSVDQAHGRVLAVDLRAARTQPPADLSAMDGYALSADADAHSDSGSGPWRIVGESRAGVPFGGALGPGEAVRISTGAHMPEGADRVLLQEDASVDETTLRAGEIPPPGRHVRKRGFDFEEGAQVLSAGSMLGPAQIALAIAAGHASCMVAAVPRIAVLDSGDELARDPTRCGPGQIPASNGPMLAAQLAPLGVRAARIGPVADDMEALARALSQSEQADILVTSGGASVGDHDLLQDALKRWGADIAFWKVAIKPGKPLLVATRDRPDAPPQVIVGLPGNPVSSFVTAFLFVLPLVRAAMGAAEPLPHSLSVRTREDLPPGGKRREFLRAVMEGRQVRRCATQDSSALMALAGADCLIDRPAGADPVEAGEEVSVWSLRTG